MSLNWTKFLSRVTPKLQLRINTIRIQNDDLKRQITELEANKPAIKWDYFKSVIEDKEFVSSLEKEVTAFKPQTYSFKDTEKFIAEDEKVLVRRMNARDSIGIASQEFTLPIEEQV